MYIELFDALMFAILLISAGMTFGLTVASFIADRGNKPLMVLLSLIEVVLIAVDVTQLTI